MGYSNYYPHPLVEQPLSHVGIPQAIFYEIKTTGAFSMRAFSSHSYAYIIVYAVLTFECRECESQRGYEN